MESWRFEKLDFIRFLANKKIMNSVAAGFLENCFNEQGYVAGGFGRAFSAAYLDIAGNFETASHYIYNNSNPSYRDDIKIRMCGDVDIFFSSTQASQSCIDHFLSRGYDLGITWHAPTVGGWGHEFLVGNVKFQLISKIGMKPVEMVSTFDLANAKIIINRDKITYNDTWVELEKNKLIGVDDHSRESLLWRINKWARRHRYVGIRHDDSEKIIENMISLIEKANIKNLKRWGNVVPTTSVLNQVNALINSLRINPEDILVASSLFNSYDQLNLIKLAVEQQQKLKAV